jgi:hypothetical protein
MKKNMINYIFNSDIEQKSWHIQHRKKFMEDFVISKNCKVPKSK